MPYQNTISFRSSDLSSQIDSRGDRHQIARRDLDRYYVLLCSALGQVNLSHSEALLLCDAFSNTINDFRVNPAQCLHLRVADAISLEQIDKKWGIDGKELLSKLKGFTTLEAAAVLDAIERFWHRSYITDNPSKRLRIVGLW
jgi:hypothetical protein